jgi:hypothetical protein
MTLEAMRIKVKKLIEADWEGKARERYEALRVEGRELVSWERALALGSRADAFRIGSCEWGYKGGNCIRGYASWMIGVADDGYASYMIGVADDRCSWLEET